LYAITAADSPNDLPLLLHLTQASRHDSGTFVAAYAQLRQLYPNLSFSKAFVRFCVRCLRDLQTFEQPLSRAIYRSKRSQRSKTEILCL